jgi:hypothetical protein
LHLQEGAGELFHGRGRSSSEFACQKTRGSGRTQADRKCVNQIVLPHFYLFAPIVYTAEVLTAMSLILRLGVRGSASVANGAARYCWPWNGREPVAPAPHQELVARKPADHQHRQIGQEDSAA